ncbi:aldehyde dehydrogenase family protein [Streptomyces lydicus]|uniref:aldehyde dehydrogenase family protein n=1 Tax=Streptomyces lydicus TaxID=47763 RepID=UPI00369782B3
MDTGAAAAELAAAAYCNAGQDCTAATRFLVHHRRYGAFVTAFAAAARTPRTGPPDDPAADCGPLNSESQLASLQGVLRRLPDHAEVVTGGTAPGGPGWFHSPTVVAGVLRQRSVPRGPVGLHPGQARHAVRTGRGT